MRKAFCGLLIFILPFLVTNISVSANVDVSDVYLIENIKCKAESTSATNAKDVAIKEAEKEALKKLFDRLKVSQENVKFINSEVLSRIINSIHVSDEVLTATKYSSTVDIQFNKEFVNYYLNEYGIKYGGVIKKKYLYIPILKVGNQYYNLLDNIWRDKTFDSLKEIKFSGFELPNNFNMLDQNPLNHVIIDKNSIEETDYNDFLELLKEHKSNTLVFVIAEYSKDNDNVEVTIKEVLTDNVSETKLNMFNKENLSYEDLMGDASLQILMYFFETNPERDSDNKNYVKIQEKVIDTDMKIHMVQSDINDVVFMFNLLRSFSFITECKISYQTLKETCFDVKTSGDINRLYSMFKENGILLQFRNSKYYVVYTGL